MPTFHGIGTLGALLLFFFQATAMADDHGNSPETATLIGTDGVPISGNIEPPGDVDYFKFDASAGNLYTIETSNLGPGSDTYLILFAPDGFTILFEDDQGGDEPNASKIVFEATQSEIYFAEVSHFSLEYGTGTYDLSVTDEGGAPPDDHGDTSSTATLIQCGTPAAGEIEVPGDVDFFSFVAQVGNFYDAETYDLPESSDTFISLFDADGTTQLLTDDQGGRETNASRVIWQASTIESLDQYYLSVVQFLSNATGAYQLLVTDMGLPISATPDGSSIQGNLVNPGDVDVFAFDAVRGHVYEIAVGNGSTGSFRLILLDTDGITELEESAFAYPRILYAAGATKPYFVLVREDLTGGDYSFSVTDGGLPDPDADFDKDGMVGPGDMYIFQQYWHSGTPTATPTGLPTATPTPPG